MGQNILHRPLFDHARPDQLRRRSPPRSTPAAHPSCAPSSPSIVPVCLAPSPPSRCHAIVALQRIERTNARYALWDRDLDFVPTLDRALSLLTFGPGPWTLDLDLGPRDGRSIAQSQMRPADERSPPPRDRRTPARHQCRHVQELQSSRVVEHRKSRGFPMKSMSRHERHSAQSIRKTLPSVAGLVGENRAVFETRLPHAGPTVKDRTTTDDNSRTPSSTYSSLARRSLHKDPGRARRARGRAGRRRRGFGRSERRRCRRSLRGGE